MISRFQQQSFLSFVAITLGDVWQSSCQILGGNTILQQYVVIMIVWVSAGILRLQRMYQCNDENELITESLPSSGQLPLICVMLQWRPNWSARDSFLAEQLPRKETKIMRDETISVGGHRMHRRVSLQVCPDQTETKLASTQQNSAQMCHK